MKGEGQPVRVAHVIGKLSTCWTTGCCTGGAGGTFRCFVRLLPLRLRRLFGGVLGAAAGPLTWGFGPIFLLGCDCDYAQPRTHFIPCGIPQPRGQRAADHPGAPRLLGVLPGSGGSGCTTAPGGGALEVYPRIPLEQARPAPPPGRGENYEKLPVLSPSRPTPGGCPKRTCACCAAANCTSTSASTPGRADVFDGAVCGYRQPRGGRVCPGHGLCGDPPGRRDPGPGDDANGNDLLVHHWQLYPGI